MAMVLSKSVENFQKEILQAIHILQHHFKKQSRLFFIFEGMKLTVNNSNLFNKKLLLLSDSEKKKVNEHVRKLTYSFENGKSFFNKNVYQPYQFNLKNNLESSLYSSKISQSLRLILSIDEDTLFNKLDVTLFDITDKNKEEYRFKKIGEKLYRSENLLY